MCFVSSFGFLEVKEGIQGKEGRFVIMGFVNLFYLKSSITSSSLVAAILCCVGVVGQLS
jgi:hypothetical protein